MGWGGWLASAVGWVARLSCGFGGSPQVDLAKEGKHSEWAVETIYKKLNRAY